MNIFLLGANGRTGREIISRALDAGDSVTALVRTKDRLADITHPQLTVQTGSACDSSTLKGMLSGHDLVISTLGPRSPTKTACTIYSEYATAIVNAMQECRINRLLITSTALLFARRKIFDRFLGFIARHNARNASLMEETIRASNLEWTIARVGFLNSKSSIDYQLEEESLPNGSNSISRAALAHFLLAESKQSNYIKKVVGLCG